MGVFGMTKLGGWAPRTWIVSVFFAFNNTSETHLNMRPFSGGCWIIPVRFSG